MHTKKKTLLWSFSIVWGKEGKQIHVTCFPFSAVVMLFSISLFFFLRVLLLFYFFPLPCFTESPSLVRYSTDVVRL